MTKNKIHMQLFAAPPGDPPAPPGDPEDPSKKYLDEIEALKAKEAETARKAAETIANAERENRELMLRLSRTPQAPAPAADRSPQEIRESLMNAKNSLEYFTAQYELYEVLGNQGDIDPQFRMSDEVAKGVKELIDAAEGDPILFSAQMTRKFGRDLKKHEMAALLKK